MQVVACLRGSCLSLVLNTFDGFCFDDMRLVLQIRNHGEIITCTIRGAILSRKGKTLTTYLIQLLMTTVCALRCIEVKRLFSSKLLSRSCSFLLLF